MPFADDFDGPDPGAGGVPHDLRMRSSRGPVPLLAVDEVRG